MANKRIQDLPAKGATIAANDILEVSEYQSPGVYTSKKILGSELGGVTSFEDLTDTFTFAGNELETVRVNAAGTALETYTPATASTGRFGIADSSGVYTYYTTLTLAMTAATSGQTIEFFTDYTETGAVTITLKDGVNINGNGHTYILSNSGTNNAFQDGGVAVTSVVSNLVVKRVLGAASITNTLCLYITGASKVTCYNLKLVQDTTSGAKTALTIDNTSAVVAGVYCEAGSPSVRVTNGTLLDATVYASSGEGLRNFGTIKNCFSSSTTSGGFGIQNHGTAYNCVAEGGASNWAFLNLGVAFNCTGRSSAGIGYYAQGVNYNCKGYSSASIGYNVLGTGNNHNCFGYSTGNSGITMQNGEINGCHGLSTTHAGINATSSGGIYKIKNSTAISYASSAILAGATDANCVIHKTSAESYWNNASGHGVDASSAGANLEVVGCTIVVANSSANCLYSSGAKTVDYANNAFKGATTPVNANITQGVTNTHDSQGNILI